MLPLVALALAQDLDFGVNPAPGPGESPAFYLTPTRDVKTLYVLCKVGGKTVEQTRTSVVAMTRVTVTFPRNESVTTADCFVRSSFKDGDVVEQDVPVQWAYRLPLSIDLSRASADLEAKTVTVRASAKVEEAEIIAYGAHKAVLDKSTVPLGQGPGDVSVPFVGDPSEVVLLDVTLRTSSAWAGFTYSPWFLDIPHEDVLFASDSDVIAADEEWKLAKVQEQLADVVDKYGSIVPIKLYVAGCTDTVGDGAHNRELSERRARSIAKWFRAHGFSYPIYYYGFGESLLAVQTGDGVDMQVNRRALYMVGANPPPAGSGVPGVGWKGL
ncbi:MAG: OmpA family protein [Deltaproteobacteria bacterium]|nr:OmpA family protein [Deltaproteobacteria bacterium]